MIWLAVIGALFVIWLVYGYLSHYHLVTTRYEVTAPVSRGVVFALLSDLHCCKHGRDYDRLLRQIDEGEPDFIVIAGDMVTKRTSTKDKKVQQVLRLLRTLRDRYEVYYAPGNHEMRMLDTETYYEALTAMGVHLLRNRYSLITDDGIRLWGLDLPHDRYIDKSLAVTEEVSELLRQPHADEDGYDILIAHDPRHFEAYAGWGADLTVCGHYHGGIMRLPLVGGVISPYLKLFPKYDAGLFQKDGRTMIVGRGLGSHAPKLRWFNPPELVFVSLLPKP